MIHQYEIVAIVTRCGVQDGDAVVIDLRAETIETWPQLWDVLAFRCALPTWFGRNLDAWWDTIQAGGISEVLDAHGSLII